MNIVVSGMGGVGGYYGALLAQEAQKDEQLNVWFVARGEHLAKITAHGLRVQTPTRDFVVHPKGAEENPSNIPVADLLIIATKSYDLERNIEQLKPVIGPSTVILPLLNGANITERIAKQLPGQTVWYGCVYISARKGEPGSVYTEADGELFFFGSGEHEQTPLEKSFLELLIRAGINAKNPENIKYVIREKFMMISTTATATSYFNETVGGVRENHAEVLTALRKELIKLTLKQGYELPADIEEKIAHRQTRMPSESTSSMHVDYQKGNPTEVDNLTGYVVEEAQRMGVMVPTYARMYQALKGSHYPPEI